MQLEDHSDKGYLISVEFDERLVAAEVLSLIRRAFEDSFPKTPIWGEKKTEGERSVSFAFTYIDEHNKLVGR